MSAPIRVQLSRKKGWRKPPNTVVVARRSKWGNPFKVTPGYRWFGVAQFRTYFEKSREAAPLRRVLRSELSGKNLACWCPLGGPCHADVLLELANKL